MGRRNESRYYRVSPRIWEHSRRHQWSADTERLALYLLTCAHRNIAGCYRLPRAYAQEDLRWGSEQFAAAFEPLCTEGFCEYDEDARVVLITQALAYDAPENPNQRKAAVRQLQELPATPLLGRLRALAEEYAPPLATDISDLMGEPPAGTTEVLERSTLHQMPEPSAQAGDQPLPEPYAQPLQQRMAQSVPVSVPVSGVTAQLSARAQDAEPPGPIPEPAILGLGARRDPLAPVGITPELRAALHRPEFHQASEWLHERLGHELTRDEPKAVVTQLQMVGWDVEIYKQILGGILSGLAPGKAVRAQYFTDAVADAVRPEAASPGGRPRASPAAVMRLPTAKTSRYADLLNPPEEVTGHGDDD